MYIIDFTPPMEGIEGNFNTFRIGGKWAKTLVKGDKVILADGKASKVIGYAKVVSVHSGKLVEVAKQHAHKNHNQRNQPTADAAMESLLVNMRKRYGPQIATDNRLTSVIYLKRLKERVTHGRTESARLEAVEGRLPSSRQGQEGVHDLR